ncbi:MAG: MMPL family transporter [Paenibacillaceae bacterium]
MKTLLRPLTDWVSTKRGMWITLIFWLIVTILLSAGPSASDYKVTGFQSLPDDAKSIIANQKIDQYFQNDQGVPALLVFHNETGNIDLTKVGEVVDSISGAKISGVKEVVAFSQLPPEAQTAFMSEDLTTVVIPVNLESSLDNQAIGEAVDQITEVAEISIGDLIFRVTGPAGIAGDTLKLFSRADIVLLLSTVVLVLILLIVIYRSPLLAFIPLLATAFVYEVVNKTLGLMGKAGLVINNQTLSIMSILVFAAVIDYSLFVFSRYREELKRYESKYEAMKLAMRETGEPVFFSGGTVLVAMLVLFFANFRDYQNFAPIFATAMAIIMLASITLVPALFTLFGRKSFWPKVPKVGQQDIKKNAIWSRIARFVTKKPGLAGGLVLLILIISSLNLFNLKYEFDTVKSFPEDMPSREGYEIVETRFDKGDLAPTTVVMESNKALSEAEIEALRTELAGQPHIASARLTGTADEGKVVKYSLSFDISPYSVEALDTFDKMRDNSEGIISNAGVAGDLYYAGATAARADERSINDRDIIVIVVLETLLILLMLFVLTRSIKMPLYMMGTILVSFIAALGLGTFLTDVLFDMDAISTRVPIYAFVFLIALGIDYNIMLVSRYKEERKKYPVRKAVEIAVSHTGGVISSAGLILAATFAALMTQPIAVLFVFGFIVAVGILLDTFLVRGILLPTFIIFFEKED